MKFKLADWFVLAFIVLVGILTYGIFVEDAFKIEQEAKPLSVPSKPKIKNVEIKSGEDHVYEAKKEVQKEEKEEPIIFYRLSGKVVMSNPTEVLIDFGDGIIKWVAWNHMFDVSGKITVKEGSVIDFSVPEWVATSRGLPKK